MKEFLSDFYLAKRVGEIIPIKKVTKESKKIKLSYEDEEDDSGSDSDKNVTLDLKKEISEYTMYKIVSARTKCFRVLASKSICFSNIVLHFNDDFMCTCYQCTK